MLCLLLPLPDAPVLEFPAHLLPPMTKEQVLAPRSLLVRWNGVSPKWAYPLPIHPSHG